jgi:hypothetical protein
MDYLKRISDLERQAQRQASTLTNLVLFTVIIGAGLLVTLGLIVWIAFSLIVR